MWRPVAATHSTRTSVTREAGGPTFRAAISDTTRSFGPSASNSTRPSSQFLTPPTKPRSLAARLFARAAFHGYTRDISDDFRVWNHKRYVETPLLARGDGPIMKYRRWAKQFY